MNLVVYQKSPSGSFLLCAGPALVKPYPVQNPLKLTAFALAHGRSAGRRNRFGAVKYTSAVRNPFEQFGRVIQVKH